MASPQRTSEFCAEAVRIAFTSGLPRNEGASDLGVCFSMVGRWIQADHRNPKKPTARTDMERELAQLRRGNRLLREERDVLKKATQFFCGAKQMTFKFIADDQGDLPINRLCEIMEASPHG